MYSMIWIERIIAAVVVQRLLGVLMLDWFTREVAKERESEAIRPIYPFFQWTVNWKNVFLSHFYGLI